MKKIILSLVPIFLFFVIITSCGKDDPVPNPPNPTTPEGTNWKGSGQYGTAPGGPTYNFELGFKTNGVANIIGNNSVAIDTTTGTWEMVMDSVRITYKYNGSSAIYILSAKYTTNATLLTGTIGLQPAVSGVGIFSVTKQ